MVSTRKFGAFSGVFTPSLLTILGVIMYMRLGWVTGQAGFWGVLIIILLAHVISYSTGLSISSIATDKKIEKGGIYYMLSRSLGLPMGGAIGLALFIGTAISISLYIVGFVESFLFYRDTEGFRAMLGLDQFDTTTNIRIIGSAVILILIIIAFISTSLAIKIQYVILTLIIGSLVAIFTGIFTTETYASSSGMNWIGFDSGASFEDVFKIFFPAVTGFTAGVAMSGDLKDPRKNIPVGTLSAITVGLIVYVLMALGLSYFIDNNALISDKEFLISLLEKNKTLIILLILGIWGATLSSALGGILGGPRILQALALDKVMPGFIGKGTGQNNEPRVALIITFLIAEIGILIGELDFIAEIVTMFYLASYGFINLAFFLESIASTDFRPKFKIPKITGLIGLLACFIIMVLLNVFAMIGAIVLMGFIYSLLKRKELQLDLGDVWQSVWTLIIRKGLQRMDKKEIEERNWQPNIMLFSGGIHQRPYLLEFGKYLVGQHGMLSNFELVEDKKQNVLFTKHEQSHSNGNGQDGFFTRRHVCRNVYEGIETISKTYGFSGVEPNTVLMGWAKQTEHPINFANMVKSLYELDLNVLLLSYHKELGFGNKKTIDIWWRGGGNNGNLALALSKFIWGTRSWREAEVRLIVINPVNSESPVIRHNAAQIFENLRIKAKIRIINNQYERRDFYDIIKVESSDTDLIFLGLPDIKEGNEQDFVQDTNDLINEIGTVVLIRASSEFKALQFDKSKKHINSDEISEPDSDFIPADTNSFYPEFDFGDNEVIASQLRKISFDIFELNKSFHQKFLLQIFRYNKKLTLSLKEIIEKSFYNYEERISKGNVTYRKKLFAKIQNNFLINSRKLLHEIQNQYLETQTETLQASINFAIKELENRFKNLPKVIINYYDLESLKPSKDDDIALRSFKFRRRLRIRTTGNAVKYTIKVKKIADLFFPFEVYKAFYGILSKWGLINAEFIVEVQKTIKKIRNLFILFEKDIEAERLDIKQFEYYKTQCSGLLDELDDLHKSLQRSIFTYSLQKATDIVVDLNTTLNKLNANSVLKKRKQNVSDIRELKLSVLKIPSLWENNQNLFFNAAIIELMLISFENRIRKTFNDAIKESKRLINETLIQKVSNFRAQIDDYINVLKENPSARYNPEHTDIQYSIKSFKLALDQMVENILRSIKNSISRMPETIDLMTNESFQSFEKEQYNNIEVIHISTSRLLDYIIQEDLLDPLQKTVDELPDKLQQINSVVYDVLRLVSFSTDQLESTLGIDFEETIENLIPFIEEQREKISLQLKSLHKITHDMEYDFQGRLEHTLEKLTLYSLTSTAVNLKHYIDEQESKRRISDLGKQFKKLNPISSMRFEKLLYRPSKAILLAKRISEGKNRDSVQVSDILNLVESISVDSKIINKIPFYYQQLFLKKHNYYKEFWFGREEMLEKAGKAIERYKKGFYGGLLVTGQQFSGKTFFSQYICSKNFAEDHIYLLAPPSTGSVNPRYFQESLERLFGIYGNYAQIFSKLPPDSVLIIDDLELWWEKSQNGFQIIEQILKLIDKYGNRCFFVVNVNIHTFKLLNKIKKIDTYFNDIIHCGAFDAENLKNILLYRHQSSGLELQFMNKADTTLKARDYALLFNKIFQYSKGNVGIALQGWITNIKDLKNNIVFIRLPKPPDLSLLDLIDTETLLLILQFVLHKRLTINKLERITMMESEYLMNKINYLKRSGLVVENFKDVYELNHFIAIHLQHKLIEKEIL